MCAANIAPAEQLFLGIDGGGSKTYAVIVDAQGNERGRGLAGSANYSAIGLQPALANLRRASEAAARQAACALPCAAAWIGLAGIDSATDQEALLPYLAPLACTLRLTNDAELVLSALDHAVGVALIAGTGAIALGRDRYGAGRRASGWGHLLGDEGSGYDIARQALQAATRAADGRGRPTLLLQRFMDYWQLRAPDDLIAQVYRSQEQTDKAEKAEIARLSALVFAAARSGDAVAQRIVRRAAHELALATLTVGSALDLPLALGGGLLLNEESYREQTLDFIRRRRPLGAVALVAEPALSAARAAVRLAETTHPAEQTRLAEASSEVG